MITVQLENCGGVVQMEWVGANFLAILFEQGTLVLWDAKDNKIVWIFSFIIYKNSFNIDNNLK